MKLVKTELLPLLSQYTDTTTVAEAASYKYGDRKGSFECVRVHLVFDEVWRATYTWKRIGTSNHERVL